MKATIEIPDPLYREVKSRTALEGKTIRSLTISLYQQWLNPAENTDKDLLDEAAPWLKISKKYIHTDTDHDLDTIRQSVERGRQRQYD